MDTCEVTACTQKVSKTGYTLCLDHWKAQRAGNLPQCPACDRFHDGPSCPACNDAPPDMLSSTRIGKHFNLSNVKINLILAELGWIEKYVKGWVPTDRGNALGANVREMRNGTPFVLWPNPILKNPVLLASIKEQSAPLEPAPPAPPTPTASTPWAHNALTPPKAAPSPKTLNPTTAPSVSPLETGHRTPDTPQDFRTKFPANFRTQDGHMVRSRAEILIDNWLYMQGIVHAYERRLPIEEECYCDFYLPGGKGLGTKGVYLEYWGLEADPKYRDRQSAKRAIYAKHKLSLIELGDPDIERLDDVLPRMLLKFGIESA